MKLRTLALLSGAGAPLIASAATFAGFTGISTTSKPNEFGLLVCNVYAEFDRPGEDYMIAIAGTANNPMLIEVIGGTFYNHPSGTDRPPLTSLVAAFPSLAFDSFVTVGVKQVGPNGQPADYMSITPGFPGVSGSSIATTTSGWATGPALPPAADPFNPDFFAGDGRLLIAQFSTMDGTAIQGMMLSHHVSNGLVENVAVSFFHVPGPGGLWLIGLAGLGGCRRVRNTCCLNDRARFCAARE